MSDKELLENIEENKYSEEVSDVLLEKPSFVIRISLFLMFMILIIVFAVSWFVEYPVVKELEIYLSSSEPRVKVISKADGRVTFFKNENDYIETSDWLGVIESPARFQDVLYLDSMFSLIESNKGGDSSLAILLSTLDFKSNLHLGLINQDYIFFLESKRKLKYQKNTKLTKQEETNVNLEIDKHKKIQKNLKEKIYTKRKIYTSFKNRLHEHKKLYASGAISKLEFSTLENQYLNIVLEIKQLEEQLILNNQSIKLKDNSLKTIEITSDEDAYNISADLIDSYDKVFVSLLNWKDKYLLSSPTNGYLKFMKQWKTNQMVAIDDEVLTIINNDDDIVAIGSLPIEHSSDVEVGQKVNIRLLSHDSNEYGYLKGEIIKLGEIPIEGVYRIEIALNNNLTTTYKKNIKFKPELTGIGEIILQDKKLIEYFFDKFTKDFDEKNEQ